MARFPFRTGYCCGKPARHTGVSHLLRLLVMQTCLRLSYHVAPAAVNISQTLYLYRFTRSYYVFSALAEKPPPPLAKAGGIPPLIYGQPERAAARRRFGDLSTPILFQTRFWLPHFSSRIAPGGGPSLAPLFRCFCFVLSGVSRRLCPFRRSCPYTSHSSRRCSPQI